MAFEPQRFIHAANVRLDVPVSVQTSESLTDELRFAFEDATLHSFDEVIQSCLRHEVDYLLLSGNIFIEADRSLRARLALLRGLNALDEQGIQVFVLPGDTDPPEAWRAIPELPDNVNLCLSSSPEPVELRADERLITTVSASMWYGAEDDFGIRVLASNEDGAQPFRIGVISRAKYEDAQRMASMAAAATDEAIAATMQNVSSGEKIETTSTDDDEDSQRVWHSLDGDESGRPRRASSGVRRKVQRSLESLDAATDSEYPSVDPEFLTFVDEMMREGKLNYLALTGEMSRATLWRDDGVVHCPGTTQARSQMEGAGGSCSLVEVSETGEVRISSVDTSSVDWKQLELDVASHSNLSTILQQMKTRLLEVKAGASDRIWSVQWILRGPLVVLQELTRSDLDVAVAVELDELKVGSRTLRLLHSVRLLPNAWPSTGDESTLADQYQSHATRSRSLTDDALRRLIESSELLTSGWKQRLSSLLPSLDPEQILAKLRTDGAAWFLTSDEQSAVEEGDVDALDSAVATAVDEEASDDAVDEMLNMDDDE